MKGSDPGAEPLAQNLIKLISNVCFSVFVFSVLVVTVIAITYQPPDPWLESAPALTKLFTQTENATFKNDDSVLKTGEDLSLLSPALSPTSAPISAADPPPPPPPAFERAEEVIANSTPKPEPLCDEAALLPVNCSDPRVLVAVKRFNARAFRSIVFLGYQTPVNGSKSDECDVAWRFRNRREKSWRKYRDFRRGSGSTTRWAGKGEVRTGSEIWNSGSPFLREGFLRRSRFLTKRSTREVGKPVSTTREPPRRGEDWRSATKREMRVTLDFFHGRGMIPSALIHAHRERLKDRERDGWREEVNGDEGGGGRNDEMVW